MFTLDEMNDILKAGLTTIAAGMIINASGYKGDELDSHLRASFDDLVALGNAVKKIAAEKFK
jgi:hypothetical protein